MHKSQCLRAYQPGHMYEPCLLLKGYVKDHRWLCGLSNCKKKYVYTCHTDERMQANYALYTFGVPVHATLPYVCK